MKLVLDLARRWWRLKVKDVSPEKLHHLTYSAQTAPSIWTE